MPINRPPLPPSVTYPLDITKTRLQVSTRPAAERRPSMLRMSYNIARREGVASLWTGLWPAICRHYGEPPSFSHLF